MHDLNKLGQSERAGALEVIYVADWGRGRGVRPIFILGISGVNGMEWGLQE